jgi:hypothetical protein
MSLIVMLNEVKHLVDFALILTSLHVEILPCGQNDKELHRYYSEINAIHCHAERSEASRRPFVALSMRFFPTVRMTGSYVVDAV